MEHIRGRAHIAFLRFHTTTIFQYVTFVKFP